MNDDDSDGAEFNEDVEKPQSFEDYLDQYKALPKYYIANMNKNEYDHKYGVRRDESSQSLYIGNSILDFDGSDVIVKNKKYKGTRGLYELLFKKKPSQFSSIDEKNYQQIVLTTNAHKRYYKANNQIDGNKLDKYKNIIAPISEPKEVAGKGLFMEMNNNKIDYVHWNDPNELVDRLRLLVASQQAGHTGHVNEINSIIEELKEAKIIH